MGQDFLDILYVWIIFMYFIFLFMIISRTWSAIIDNKCILQRNNINYEIL